ncbi:TolB family protein [Cohnella nanjingensis]|uniref:WD40 repeat domain-containing protein n=1 Tax=Cohnella nanjingensis TaxID=1387779 RepID=A0A7X0VH83_9BACL|nr:WD40 repeat domain-containing protein [Cohnella nanjingensis]MBB6672384.1 WD40 repeat domain-containing protein [Cohnella nanjingensis]
MKAWKASRTYGFGAAIALLSTLVACQPSQDRLTTPSPADSLNGGEAATGTPAGDPAGEGRKLTIVKGSGPKAGQDVAIARIHRLEGASVDAWLSDDAVRITTTKLIKPATGTEEAKFAYETSKFDLTRDLRQEVRPVKMPSETEDAEFVRDNLSPDGRYSFRQTWRNKYEASNAIVNLGTGASVEVRGDNYLEKGGWFDNGTYVLAAGSMEGRGDLRLISTDGAVATLQLDDPDVEVFDQFDAGQGRIYYIDKHNNLKTFAPNERKPKVLVRNVVTFKLSPGGGLIAATSVNAAGSAGSDLHLFGSEGDAKGSLLGKGDLVPDLSWSPDGSKLAFSVYAEDQNGMNGVYLLHAATGKVSLVAPYAFPQYPLTWNPSGTRLAVTTADKQGISVTQIIDFK